MPGGWEGDATDLLVRLLLLYPARPDTLPQPWRDHVLVLVDADLDGVTGTGRAALRRRVVQRLEEVFPQDESMFRLEDTRFAVVARRHPGLVGTLQAFEDLVQIRGLAGISAWCEELPPDPETLASFVRSARRTEPVRGLAAVEPLLAGSGVVPMAPRRPRPARAWALGAVSAAAAAVAGLLVVGSMLAASDGGRDTVVAGGVPSESAVPASSARALGDSGYVLVGETREANGVTRLLVAPAPESGSETSTSAGELAPGSTGPTPGAGVAAAQPEPVTLLIVGLDVEEALAALPEGLVAAVVFAGVPEAAELPAGRSVAIALDGPTPPELCALLVTVTDALVVAGQPDCPALPTATDASVSSPGLP